MNDHAQTLNQALLLAMDRYATVTCFKIKPPDSPYQDISYQRFQMLTLRLAHFFLQQGLKQGDRIAIIADNCLEWMIAYMACHLAGGVAVPLRISLSEDMIYLTLQASEASLAVVAGEVQHYLVADAGQKLPHLKTVITLQNMECSAPGLRSIHEILGVSLTAEQQNSIRTYAKTVPSQALASIHYTASETGSPKGAVFTQLQRLQTLQFMAEWFSFEEDDLVFTYLHGGSIYSLNVSLHAFLSGVANALSNSGETVLDDIRQVSPTLLLVTPLSLEIFYNNVMSDLDELPQASQEVFQWAVAIGKEYQAVGPAASETLREEYARADMTFFSRIRGQVGGRVRRLYTVGAPLPQRFADFMEIIGVAPLPVYSVTEAGGFPAVNRPAARRPDSCGQVAPGFQIRLAEDGEVLIKSPTVMQSYWQQPEATTQMIDANGWLHTGDVGHFDRDGYLYLTGRKEPVMILSSGRKVIPSRIESALKESPFIAQSVVFGEGRPYVSALIVPDLEVLADHFQESLPENEQVDLPDPNENMLRWFWEPEDDESEPVVTTAHPQVRVLLDKVVQTVNTRLDRWEQIRQYSLVEQALGKAAHELADLSPQKRQRIAQRYAAPIRMMYPQISQLKDEEITRVQVTPERMRELLEKASILDAWLADAGIGFLFELARQKQIDAPSIVHICDTAASLAQMENEGTPLSTALIVGNPARVARVLPPSRIQLLRSDHIRRMRKILVTLAPMVDGTVLGYVVDKHGYVRGIHKLDLAPDEHPANRLLGPQFRRHAAISRQCDALVFFVPLGGRQVRVFADGQLVGRYSNGDWSPESIPRVDEIVARLVEQKSYKRELVQRILRCAFQMSEENLGAIFIIGNADIILEHSDAPEISYFASIISTPISSLTDEELINFAKQDGATLIDIQGSFRGCMVLLRPNAATRAEIGPGKGARHSSAAKMSAEAQCLAITVSQDGPITIYNNGERVLSL